MSVKPLLLLVRIVDELHDKIIVYVADGGMA